jgi:hypothetical protein
MRIIKSERGYFRGTHKGHEIEIQRDHDFPDRHFYIWVRCLNSGLHAYDGYAPLGVTTMAEAKREALYGACLEPRPTAEWRKHSGGDNPAPGQDVDLQWGVGIIEGQPSNKVNWSFRWTWKPSQGANTRQSEES